MMLGLSVDAVRKRAERGTLKREKGEDGTVYVLLDSTQTGHASNGDKLGDESATGQRLVAILEEQVEHLRRQLEIANEANRENRRIIAGLIERVPALETAPQSGPEAPVGPPSGGGGVGTGRSLSGGPGGAGCSMPDREDEARQRSDRDYDLLKHFSTLNVAALILLIALVEDFRPTANVASSAPRSVVFAFGASLILSMSGLLLMTLLDESEHRSPMFRSLLIVPAGLSFLVGMAVAVTIGLSQASP